MAVIVPGVVALFSQGAPVDASSGAPPQSGAPHTFSFRLADSNGTIHTERELQRAPAAVLFFMMPDCPISQGYVPEMNRIADTYAARGVRFFAVQADLTASAAAVRRHVSEYGYHFPVLIDPQQRLVRHTGVTVTPEAVVMTAAGSVLYQGRIDNRIASLGIKRPQATEFDLRNALEAVLMGHPVATAKTPAYGCLITKIS
jgi:peroxiredoxin